MIINIKSIVVWHKTFLVIICGDHDHILKQFLQHDVEGRPNFSKVINIFRSPTDFVGICSITVP